MALNNKQLFDELNKREDLANFSNIDIENAWKQLLEILKTENGADFLNHYFFREDDFTDSSIVKTIEDKADPSNAAFTALEQSLKELQSKFNDDTENGLDNGTSGSFWNESVNKALVHYLKYISVLDKSVSIPGTNGYITYDDIWDADAGNSFSSSETAKWVKPWINIDGDSYKIVRSDDCIISGVLDNENNLQFTHNVSVADWIRLLMPMYERFVEIEDLDRNFWVIGQVITGICTYLFDQDGPIAKSFRNLLKEVGELWENILYLWAALALMNKRVYTDVHVEVIYLNSADMEGNKAYFTNIKYDNFTNDELSWEQICQRLEYLKQEYSESNLAIIPIRREKNYYHNYYSIERYPGIAFFDRNNPNSAYNGFRILSFADISNYPSIRYTPINNSSSEIDDFGDYLIGVCDDGIDSVRYAAPLSKIDTYSELIPSNFIGAIRSQIGDCDVQYDTEEKCLKLGTSFNIVLSDACGAAVKDATVVHDKVIGTYSLNTNSIYSGSATDPTHITNIVSDDYILIKNSGVYRIDSNLVQQNKPTNTQGIKVGTWNKGYYLGELSSNYKTSLEMELDLSPKFIQGIPFNSGGYVTKKREINKTNVNEEDEKLLRLYTTELDNDKMQLYTIRHATYLFSTTGDNAMSEHYEVSNNTIQEVTWPEDNSHIWEKSGSNWEKANSNTEIIDYEKGSGYTIRGNETNWRSRSSIYSSVELLTPPSLGIENKTYEDYFYYTFLPPVGNELYDYDPEAGHGSGRYKNYTSTITCSPENFGWKKGNSRTEPSFGRAAAPRNISMILTKDKNGRITKDNWVILLVQLYTAYGLFDNCLQNDAKNGAASASGNSAERNSTNNILPGCWQGINHYPSGNWQACLNWNTWKNNLNNYTSSLLPERLYGYYLSEDDLNGYSTSYGPRWINGTVQEANYSGFVTSGDTPFDNDGYISFYTGLNDIYSVDGNTITSGYIKYYRTEELKNFIKYIANPNSTTYNNLSQNLKTLFNENASQQEVKNAVEHYYFNNTNESILYSSVVKVQATIFYPNGTSKSYERNRIQPDNRDNSKLAISSAFTTTGDYPSSSYYEQLISQGYYLKTISANDGPTYIDDNGDTRKIYTYYTEADGIKTPAFNFEKYPYNGLNK